MATQVGYFWTIEDFEAVYGLTLTDAQAEFAIQAAQDRVETVTTETCFTTAQTSGTLQYRVFRKAVGDLARYGLIQQGTITPGITRYVEKYDGTRSYEKQFGRTTDKVIEGENESTILAKLKDCLKPEYAAEYTQTSALPQGSTFTSKYTPPYEDGETYV